VIRDKLWAPAMSPPNTTNAPLDEADKAVENLVRLLAILRRRWLVVLTTTALALVGAFVAIALLQPRWRASATIVLHLSGPQVLDKMKGVGEDAEGRLMAYKEYYQTQREIIGSRVIAEQALAALGLAQDPVFLGIDRIRSEPERLAKQAEIDPVERLRELTFVEEVRGSRVLEVSADYPDPEIAADVANAVADAYLAYVQGRRTNTGVEAKKNVSAERAQALASLQEAEKKMSDYKESHGISSISLSDRQNEITEAVIATSAHLKQAEADHFRDQAAYDEARRLQREGSLASASLLPQSERRIFEDMRVEQLTAEREVEQLSVKYGDKMPELQQARRRLALINGRIERESKELLESLKARANAALKTKQRLEASLEVEKKKALELSLLERDYRALERDARTAGETYTVVAQRDAEIGMTNRTEAEGVEILDRATRPREPVFPPKGLIIAIALVGGLALGAIFALGVDLRDHRIRGLVDLERALASLGVPVLAQLPLLPADARLGVANARAQRRQRDLHAFLYPQSLMAERCRGLRTSLTFVTGSSPCRTLMVTSPNSSEGKSSTALNLAMSFCQAGKKVLLIDADMRRPRLHQVFEPPLGREELGLSSLLTGAAALEACLLRGGADQPEGLDVLLCGAIPQNPAELLDSPAARRLLGELRERYEVILIDSPPVLPVTDPLILARLADGVLIVARCQSTSRAELQRAISTLRQGDTNLLGVVLNEVDPRSEESGYSVGYYAYRAREPGAEIS
jgi:succinoglycan biosynthesis transport protein ExoP